jgi:hypothetical protein
MHFSGPKERHLESLIHSTLRDIVLTHMHPRTLIQLTLQIVNTPEQENTLPASFVRVSRFLYIPTNTNKQHTGPLTPPSPPKRLHPRLPQRLHPSNQHIHLHNPLHLTLWFHLCQSYSQSFALSLINPRLCLFVHRKLDLGFERGRVRYRDLGKGSR